MTQFLLNGAPRKLDKIEPGRTVLEYLRLDERLTATKEGCAEGDCGACTIVLGRPDEQGGLKFQAVNACIMLASELDGLAVVTAEGLAASGALEATQQAIVNSHASQCGFCTPGFVMSLYAYGQGPVPENPQAAIYDALAGNLCRCTGYRPIVDAALSLPHRQDARAQDWLGVLQNLADEDDANAPRSLDELDAVLAKNPNAKLLNGGTDLGVGIAKYGAVPEALVSLRRVAGLHGVVEASDALVVGAAATYADILPHLQKHFPAFAALIGRIGAVQIRNLGSMGGNICNASPIGDSAPCLLALNAKLHIRSAKGKRVLPIDEFFTGYRKTVLQPGEYLAAIEVPYLQPDERFFAYKIAKRFDQDISTVAAAFCLRVQGDKIAAIRTGFGGMAATPARARILENSLLGEPLAEASFAKAAKAIAQDFTPLSDFRAPALYRVQAAEGLVQKLGAELCAAETVTDIWAL